MFLDLTVICLSGAIGACARYLSYVAGRSFWPGVQFPWITLAINSLGCLLIGIVMTLVERAVPYHRHLFLIGAVGFLGSFTTFSTFGFETLELLRSGQIIYAILNIVLNIFIGLIGVWVGILITETGFPVH